MKGRRICLLVISLVILMFDVALVFVLNSYSNKNTSVLYIISKSVAVLSFLGIVILGLCKKDNTSYFWQYAIAIVFQFVPLAIRYISFLNNGLIKFRKTRRTCRRFRPGIPSSLFPSAIAIPAGW